MFNPTKCVIIPFRKSKDEIHVKLGREVIEVKDKGTHLGVVISNSLECIKQAVENKVQECKNMCYATQSLGSKSVPVTPKTSSKIYWSVVVPKLCYGTEVLDLDNGSTDVMEQFHCNMAKHMQRLPKNASNLGSLLTIGWENLQSHCNFLKLLFLLQILMLPISSVYKSLCIKRLCYIIYSGAVCKGPLNGIINVCKEYGLFGMTKMAVESGDYMQRKVWKQYVKDYVSELERKRIKTKCMMYNNLKLLDVRDFKMCVWWTHSSHNCNFIKQNEYIVRLLLNVSCYRQTICSCCDSHMVNNVSHILFVCKALDSIRSSLLNEVQKKSPANIIRTINRMQLEEKTRFILNAFYAPYIPEWKNMYDSVSNFIYRMIVKYETISNNQTFSS